MRKKIFRQNFSPLQFSDIPLQAEEGVSSEGNQALSTEEPFCIDHWKQGGKQKGCHFQGSVSVHSRLQVRKQLENPT